MRINLDSNPKDACYGLRGILVRGLTTRTIYPMKTTSLAARYFSACLLIVFATSANSEELSPARSAIESTASKMREFSSKNDWPAWVGLFAEDSTFTNPIVSEPVVGRDAILKMAKEWPKIENVEQWRVIEGSRMVIGYRERGILEGGRTTSWYRGVQTVVFNSGGQIQEFETVFNVWDVIKAKLMFWTYENPEN